MPIARRKQERVYQLFKWLQAEYPAPFPVSVYAVTGPLETDCRLGDCWRDGKRIIIRLDMRQARREALDTLMHEWAHAITIRHAHVEQRRLDLGREHDDEWALAYGRIYRHYHDGPPPRKPGRLESGKVPVKLRKGQQRIR